MSRVRVRRSFGRSMSSTLDRPRSAASGYWLRCERRSDQPYSDTVAENDIRALYNTGQVQNVRIFGQPEGDGVKVIVAVQTRTMLNEIQIDGATRISREKAAQEHRSEIKHPVARRRFGEGPAKDHRNLSGARVSTMSTCSIASKRLMPAAALPARFTRSMKGSKGAVSTVRFRGQHTSFSDRMSAQADEDEEQKTLISFVDKSGRLDEAQLQQDLENGPRVLPESRLHRRGRCAMFANSERAAAPCMIVIAIDEGPQYHVGKLIIVGYKATTRGKVARGGEDEGGLGLFAEGDPKMTPRALADGYGSGGYVDLTILPESFAGPRSINRYHLQDRGRKALLSSNGSTSSETPGPRTK